MSDLTPGYIPGEIKQATQDVLDTIQLKQEYIQSLEEYIALLQQERDERNKLLKVKDQIIANRDNNILDLKLKLDEVMELAKRAVKVAEQNII